MEERKKKKDQVYCTVKELQPSQSSAGTLEILLYLDVLLVELGVVLREALWLHPRALLGLQVVVVVVSSLHPVLHPLAAIIAWTDGTTCETRRKTQLLQYHHSKCHTCIMNYNQSVQL